MKSAKHPCLLVLFSALVYFLPAQNIVISTPNIDTLIVCTTDTFRVQVQNNHAVPLSGALLSTALPQGLTYVAGTVFGASQQNISNLSEPIFGLPDVPANQSVTITFTISVDCAAADLLDAMQVFVASTSVTSALGNAQFNTTIKVETGGILIQSVTPALLAGEKGDTLKRTICVQNTRIGKIGNLHFDDSHQPGFDISIVGANSQANGPAFFSAAFDGSFFATVGNGDQWLDQFESVCFEEQIVITSCGIPGFTNTSILRAGWGCGGDVCRYDTFNPVFIQINPSTKIPDLVFEQIWAPPTDYCGNTPAVMGYKIKNIGKADAKNISFNPSLTEGLTQSGMVANSFRLVTTTSNTPILASSSNPTFLTACNLSAVNEASFLIPLIAAKDSLQFLFDVITCVNECEQVQPAFRADYLYTKDCPVNGFVSGNALIIPEDRYFVQGDVKSSIGACLEPGQSYPFLYEAVGKYLMEDGFWHLVFDLPLGITFDANCGTLLGSNAPVLFETNPLPDGGQNIHLAWATPVTVDSLAMNFCLHYECDTNIVCIDLPTTSNGGVIYSDYCCFVRLNDATYWSPALNTLQACAISDCHEKILALNLACVPEDDPGGDTTGIIPNIPTPGLRDWWNANRLNLGYRDTDDDRHADLPLMPPSIDFRRDRFLAGDTLRVEYCGVMDSFTTVDTIGRVIWHEIVGGDMGANDNDIFSTTLAKNGFVDSTKVRWIGNTIRVRYADGTEAICLWDGPKNILDKNYFQIVSPNSFPLEPIDDVASLRYFFLFSLPQMFADGCLPKPVLEKGDSIFILSDFKIDVNFKPTSSNNPDPPLVGFRTASSASGKIYAWNEKPRKYFQYSGWKKSLAPNTHSIKPCENSVESKKFRYSMRIARENMFPFEVRPLAWISDYRQTLPLGLELASADLEYLTLQDSVPFKSNISLPFSYLPGFLDVDFAPAFIDPVDEGFTLRSNLKFKPNCQFNAPDTSKQYIETSFTGCLNGDQMIMLDSIKNAIGFFSNTPRLKILTNDSVIYSPSRTFEIDFDIKNLVGSPAPSTWVAVVSPSGQASDFKLFLMPQNQSVNGSNGLFNLGNIIGNTQKSFRIEGQNIACDADSLLLIFGWGCAPIASLADADCGRDTYLIRLNLERPELELDIISEPASLSLCDTSDWFEFEIYNAKIGFAYDLNASAKLPQGLRVVPGTCQVSYPAGAPWINIADPNLLSGNLFQWQVNDILPVLASNGLPGINLSPENTFQIRFKTIAECGFVSNTPIIYGTTGVEPCGRKTNALNKPGDPLHILGIDPPTYGVQISMQPIGPPVAECGQFQDFTVSLNILGTPSAGDSVYILLPQGVTYQPGSYVPGPNGPAAITLNTLGFQLPVPVLSGGGMMEFRFRVNLGLEAGCVDQIIVAQTRVRTVAFCQSLGAPCEVYISTGETIWNLDIARTQLLASNANFTIINGQVNGTVTITNIGNIAANGATAQIWQDTDGDGKVSTNDVLLQTLQSTTTIAPGGTVQLTDILQGLDSSHLCGLLIVLPGADNCACDDQILPLENINLDHTALAYCQLIPVTLGVPEQAGFSYQWQPASAVACPSCATTTFIPDANTPLNTPQILTLVEDSDSCKVTHTFEITFDMAFAQIMGSPTICDGVSAVLAVTPQGASYFWQGPGIQNPSQATHTVQTSGTSLYTVTITFASGCVASDSLEITTLTQPTTTEQQAFCYGDSLLVYDSLFTGSGTLTLVYDAFNGCDSTHLVTVTENPPIVLATADTLYGTFGQIITLTGPNGYVTYTWAPTPTPPCTNCPTVTYPADSSGYHAYLLTVMNMDGCPGELLFRVFIFPPCSADSLYIPNAFTPNGDGKNDVFRVVKHEGTEVVSSLEIYDRWGEKVYENQGNAFWDGTIDGQPAPSDVYVYIVKITCGELVGKRVGDVTLLR